MNQIVQDDSIADCERIRMRKSENATLYTKPNNGFKQNPFLISTKTIIKVFRKLHLKQVV